MSCGIAKKKREAKVKEVKNLRNLIKNFREPLQETRSSITITFVKIWEMETHMEKQGKHSMSQLRRGFQFQGVRLNNVICSTQSGLLIAQLLGNQIVPLTYKGEYVLHLRLCDKELKLNII